MKKNHLMLLLFCFLGLTSFSQNEEDVFIIVESMPTYSGCEGLSNEALDVCTKKKIQEYTATITYPEKAIKKSIQGKVYISFVVNKDGNVTEVKLFRGIQEFLDNAAIAHIQKMPKFVKSGSHRGKPVKVKYTIPIIF